MTDTKAPAHGRYQITSKGGSHSRFERVGEGKAIYGQIPGDAVMVHYSRKNPAHFDTILLTEAEAKKLAHMGLVRLLDGGTLTVPAATSQPAPEAKSKGKTKKADEPAAADGGA